MKVTISQSVNQSTYQSNEEIIRRNKDQIKEMNKQSINGSMHSLSLDQFEDESAKKETTYLAVSCELDFNRTTLMPVEPFRGEDLFRTLLLIVTAGHLVRVEEGAGVAKVLQLGVVIELVLVLLEVSAAFSAAILNQNVARQDGDWKKKRRTKDWLGRHV